METKKIKYQTGTIEEIEIEEHMAKIPQLKKVLDSKEEQEVLIQYLQQNRQHFLSDLPKPQWDVGDSNSRPHACEA